MGNLRPLEGAGKVLTFVKTTVSYFIILWLMLMLYLTGISIVGRVQHGAGVFLDYGLLAVIGITIHLLSTFYENIKLNVDRRTHAEVALAQYAHLSGASDDAGIVHYCFWGTLWSHGFNLMGVVASFFSVVNQPHYDFSTVFLNTVIALLWSWACDSISRRWLKKPSVDKNGNPTDFGILDKPELYRDWAKNMTDYWDRLRFNKFLEKQNRDTSHRDRDHDGDGDGDGGDGDGDGDGDESPPRRY